MIISYSHHKPRGRRKIYFSVLFFGWLGLGNQFETDLFQRELVGLLGALTPVDQVMVFHEVDGGCIR